MTLPAKHKRSTRRERIERREDFQALKAATDASPDMLAYRAKNDHDDAIGRAKVKMKCAAAGHRVPPFTARHLGVLREDVEIAELRRIAVERIRPLSSEQRARLHENLLQLFVPLLIEEDFFAYVGWPDRPRTLTR